MFAAKRPQTMGNRMREAREGARRGLASAPKGLSRLGPALILVVLTFSVPLSAAAGVAVGNPADTVWCDRGDKCSIEQGDPYDFTGDVDPGAEFGPNRMWLTYDDLINEWVVNGKCNESISGRIWCDQFTDSMTLGVNLESSVGELFQFEYGDSDVPCLVYYDNSDTRSAEVLRDNGYFTGIIHGSYGCRELADPHEAMNSLTVVRAPDNREGDWMIVANGNQDFVEFQVGMSGAVELGGDGDALIDYGWYTYELGGNTYFAENSLGMAPALPAGQGHVLFYVWSDGDEKPCIKQGDTTYIYDDMYAPMNFASDDFCLPEPAVGLYPGAGADMTGPMTDRY